MVYSSQRFPSLPFSPIAFIVKCHYRTFFLPTKLAFLALFALSTLASIIVPGSPFVGRLLALTNQQTMLLSNGVILTTQILQTSAGQVQVHMLSLDLTEPGV